MRANRANVGASTEGEYELAPISSARYRSTRARYKGTLLIKLVDQLTSDPDPDVGPSVGSRPIYTCVDSRRPSITGMIPTAGEREFQRLSRWKSNTEKTVRLRQPAILLIFARQFHSVPEFWLHYLSIMLKVNFLQDNSINRRRDRKSWLPIISLHLVRSNEIAGRKLTTTIDVTTIAVFSVYPSSARLVDTRSTRN